ncbi:hypothetical protein [Ectopseudomonas alcaliphila]|uniref:Periplasmic protein-like protein n=1 Tax=Ectopseudomonas alcaliphila TaxID=101564 RepID=A0A1G6UIL8_9GAMM|nr:hypothetical protein [Pseudomonas alcaliphila]MDX5991555.1 hypothetical protein [Pseudomonas alcaliphila]SDD41099.1 hypothetical protein SAMN05216575_101507 [Pseudomonas alcaliphila]
MIVQRLRFALIATTLFTALNVQAQVEVEANAGLLAAKISEEIAPGDYEKLLQGLRANPGKHKRKVVLLDSIGGSAPEAIRMGRLLRETGFEALVPSGGMCQGSCIYLLAAGTKRTINGHVALRRPPFPAGDSALAQTAHGSQPFSPARYFRDMGVDVSLAEEIYQVAPGRLRLLSKDELVRYRLK